MIKKADAGTLGALLVSWSTALGGLCGAAVLTVVGQAVGAMLGGCSWIGATLPIHRQPWALVNQPNLAFSSELSGLGYWLGGSLLCLLAAVLIVNVVPRPRGLSWELAAVQAAWGAASVGLGWFSLLDPWDGHLSKMLRLHGLSPAWAWAAPVVGAWAGLIATHRLLALVRASRPRLSRAGRLATVSLHLVLPVILWVGAASVVAVSNPPEAASDSADPSALLFRLWAPAFAALFPSVAALGMAWFGYPRAWAGKLAPLSPGIVVAPLLLVFATLALCMVFGRPMPEGACSGVQWSAENSRNNIRPWIRPLGPGSRARTIILEAEE